MKEYKGLIVFIILACVLTMTIGFAALSQRLNINGTSSISSVWDVKITNITSKATGKASDATPPEYTDTTAKFDAALVSPGDTMTYDITVTNAGTLDAILEKINMTTSNNAAIEFSYSGITEGDILKAETSTNLQVVVKYLESVTTQPEVIESNLIVTLDYKQYTGESVPETPDFTNTLGTRASSSSYWFDSRLTNASIESITFTTTNVVPSDVGDNYFDASAEQNGSIMGWFYDADSDGLYEVTVGQKGGVVANVEPKYMFQGLSNVTAIDLSNLNTSNVTTMHGMFWGCSSLTLLDVSSLDTSNVTSMYTMFFNCVGLTSLDLSNFDTSNVTFFGSMFDGCSSLTSVNLSSFDTSNVTNMGNMFYRCSSLTSLDVSNFDTSNVTEMGAMFASTNLTSLDLSNFDTSKVTSMSNMFKGCTKLETIYASDLWDTSKVTSSSRIFDNCTSLVGAISYDSTKTVATYANYTDGYFTYKAASNS